MQIAANLIEDGTTSRLHEVILFRARSGTYYLIDEDLQTGNVDMREISKREATEFQSLVEVA
jgi:hypothetical protein